MGIDIEKLKKYMCFEYALRYPYAEFNLGDAGDIGRTINEYDDKIHPLLATIKRGDVSRFTTEEWERVFQIARNQPYIFAELASTGKLTKELSHRVLIESRALITEPDESFRTSSIKNKIVRNIIKNEMFDADIQRTIIAKPKILLEEIDETFDKKYIIPVYESAIAQLEKQKKTSHNVISNFDFQKALKWVDDFKYLRKMCYDGIRTEAMGKNEKVFFLNLYGNKWRTYILKNKYINLDNPQQERFIKEQLSEGADLNALDKIPKSIADKTYKEDIEKNLKYVNDAPDPERIYDGNVAKAITAFCQLRRLNAMSEDEELKAVTAIIKYHKTNYGKQQNYTLRNLVGQSKYEKVILLTPMLPHHKDRKSIYWSGKYPINIIREEMEKTVKNVKNCIKKEKFREIKDGWIEDIREYVKIAPLQNIDDYGMLIALCNRKLTSNIVTSKHTPKEVLEKALSEEYKPYHERDSHPIFGSKPTLLFATVYNLTMRDAFSEEANNAINTFFDEMVYDYKDTDYQRRINAASYEFGKLNAADRIEYYSLEAFLNAINSDEEKNKFLEFLAKTAEMPNTNLHHQKFASIISKVVEEMWEDKRWKRCDLQNIDITEIPEVYLIMQAEDFAYQIRAQNDISIIADKGEEFIKIMEELNRRGIAKDVKERSDAIYMKYLEFEKQEKEDTKEFER